MPEHRSSTPTRIRPSQLTTGAWQHVAATMSGGIGTVYVNGAQVWSHAQGYTPQATGNTLRIRVDYQHSFFDGSIDDVRIYTRALTPTEIAALAADK